MQVFIRAGEGCAPPRVLQWDTIWNADAFAGTWGLAGAAAPGNAGGLRAEAALETSVILSLFTDARCPPNHPLAKYVEDADHRGYWGDGIDVRADLGEGPLGSLLWLLERTVATEDTARWAQSLSYDALAHLLKQRAIARLETSASLLAKRNGMLLNVGLYGRDGASAYDRRFEIVWTQLSARAA